MASLKAALSAVAFCACAVSAPPAVAGTVSLGSFTFNADQFGDTLSQSDGGTFAAANWVNIVFSDPGSPAYLTGANFDTGIANIGLQGPVSYTIGYNTPITNNSGADIGVVTARFSFGDAVTLTINGITKTYGPDPDPAISTGVNIPYYYGNGPIIQGAPLLQPADLWVTLIDLNDFSVAGGGIYQLTCGNRKSRTRSDPSCWSYSGIIAAVGDAASRSTSSFCQRPWCIGADWLA